MGLWTYSRLRSSLPFWNYMRPFITMNINQSVTKHRQVSGMSLYSTLLWMCQAYKTILETVSPYTFRSPQGLLSFLSSFSCRLQVTVLTKHGLPPHTKGQLGQGTLQRMEANLKLKPAREAFMRNQQKDLHRLKKEATHKAQVNSSLRSYQLQRERDLEMNHLEPIASPLQFTVKSLLWHHKDRALHTGLKPCNSSGKYFLTTCYVLQRDSALATRTGRRVYTFLGRLWEQTRRTYSALLSPEVALANRDYGTAHWEHTLPTVVLSAWCYQVKLSFFFLPPPPDRTANTILLTSIKCRQRVNATPLLKTAAKSFRASYHIKKTTEFPKVITAQHRDLLRTFSKFLKCKGMSELKLSCILRILM